MKTKEGKELLDVLSPDTPKVTHPIFFEDEESLEIYQDGFYIGYVHALSFIYKAMTNGSELYWESFLDDLVTVLYKLREDGYFTKN